MIRGKMTRVRPLEERDQEFIVRLNSDPSVRGNVVGWDFPTSVFEQKRWFSSSRPGVTHRWIVENLSGEAIGLTGLWDIDWHNRNALTALKIGGLDSSLRGRGFGRDAIKAVAAFAFYDVGLHRLHTSILASNVASLKAYVDHCNWRVEGSARGHVWRHGQYVDLHHVGILKADFDELPDADDYVQLIVGERS